MSSFGRNLRFALRQLARNPGFTATVIITLALSIGANTAIFSVVNALMLKSLPYPQPDRIGTLFQREQGPDRLRRTALDRRHPVGAPARQRARAHLRRLRRPRRWCESPSRPRRSPTSTRAASLRATSTSSAFIPRSAAPSPQTKIAPKDPRPSILSYNLWHNIFGSDRNLIGQTIHLKGEPYTVIGILPQGATHSPQCGPLHRAPAQPRRRRPRHQLRRHLPPQRLAQPGSRPMPKSIAPGPIASPRSKAKIPAPKSPITPCRCSAE